MSSCCYQYHRRYCCWRQLPRWEAISRHYPHTLAQCSVSLNSYLSKKGDVRVPSQPRARATGLLGSVLSHIPPSFCNFEGSRQVDWSTRCLHLCFLTIQLGFHHVLDVVWCGRVQQLLGSCPPLWLSSRSPSFPVVPWKEQKLGWLCRKPSLRGTGWLSTEHSWLLWLLFPLGLVAEAQHPSYWGG